MRVFLVDPHSIYRRGLVACLEGVDEVTSVTDAASVDAAWAEPALLAADVVLVDNDLPGAHDFIRELRERTGTSMLVCSARSDQKELLAAVQAGAVGYLCKDTLTPDALVASLRTAATGSGVVAPDLLGDLLRTIARASNELLEPRGLSLSPLTVREQEVLRLVADGHPTREVAKRLSYSERTVKNVIHDVVTKFNARSRSQAVAVATREGLI
ncbi:MAG TPA: response regulator transcription factor [Gaiellaceae bacterium]|jgi:DNA-binding NarL/FixJ family response regulator